MNFQYKAPKAIATPMRRCQYLDDFRCAVGIVRSIDYTA